jgi:hypothetical protein
MAIARDIYVYKMTVDNGGAPCVRDGLLSLAICKPKIRRTAEKGALLFGFSGKSDGERLLFVARITHKEHGAGYYIKPKYVGRPDRIYRDREGKAELRPGARYHADGASRDRDVGPRFERADVLLSEDFRYFGAKGDDEYKESCSHLAGLIESLTQGHRRYHLDTVRGELESLQREVWKRYKHMKVGGPSDEDTTRPCNDEVPCRVC